MNTGISDDNVVHRKEVNGLPDIVFVDSEVVDPTVPEGSDEDFELQDNGRTLPSLVPLLCTLCLMRIYL
jgi:hypothetical protein